MVGLSDIIPFVGRVVERISDAAVDAMFRGFRYMFRSKYLVKMLDTQVKRANTEEDRVSREVAKELSNGKLIEAHVLEWQKEAEETRESAKELTEKYKNRHSWRCIQCLPVPNPVSRFRLGREAVRKTERLTELINSGKELLANEIARLAPDENLPKSNTEFQKFQSREDAYGELWEALVTGSSPILGIYGMPGVGKTRMMEQIWKEAKEKKIFDKVIRVNVGSENEDVIQLQKQMAGYLDCNFQSQDNVESRASQLKQSLLNAGKALVILDDVWREIPLDDIGIPCGDGTSSVGCKILLTSREKKVCLLNNCNTPVKITPLPDDEAWDQFRNIVGTAQINSMQDESLARQVCKKCAGLPLLIHAVGKALKFMPHNSWVDALKQLEKGKFENIPGIDPQVYACVKLSIDKLPDDAKTCLFLCCCLFPEDAVIFSTKLIQLATGSQLVSDGESRVLSMVDTLRSSSLLLDCGRNDMTKLHDLIRDVGRSIAARDPKYAFLHVKCGLRLPDNADFGTSKFLRLDLESDNVHIPDDLVCPDLHSLWLICNNHVQQFSGGLFSMSANLRFLYVEVKDYSPSKLQFSLQSWGKLKTLILNRCDLTHINKTNVGLFPEYLETLCIRCCRLPKPLNLSNLKYLRKLDICIAEEVLQFMPNTISSLSSLEELHIPHGFKIWGEGSETNCDDSSVPQKPILVEISQLARLTSLQISLNRSEPFHDTTIFDNLQNFNIRVGVSPEHSFYHPFKKSIELYGNRIEVFESLIERAEEVIIEKCDNMEHLARMSQGEIQHSRRTSFSKLTCLEIRNCSALRYLFCNSVAKCLAQLQKLTIKDCHVMEAIVMNEGSSNEDIINFSNLKELVLSGMPRLKSFYREKKDAVIPSIQLQPLFHGMVVEFPSLEKLEIGNLEDASDIWGRDYDNDNSGSSFCKLKSLFVHNCDNLKTVVPVDMLHKLQNLESLRISDCSSVISEVGKDARNTDVLLALSHMCLDGLPCLTETWLNSRNRSTTMTLYPNLKKLEIDNCNSLRNVFMHSSVARDFMHLEKIQVRRCKMMREIIGKGEQEEITDVLVFPKLTVLQLEELPNLISFWCYEANASKVEFPNLVELKISSCGKINLETIEFGRDDFTCQLNSLTIRCDNEIQLPCKWQPRLYNLKRLVLSRCWWHEVKPVCFQRLEWLEVDNYGFSTHFFTCSVFKNLQQLKELRVSYCRLLEGIVEDAAGDETDTSDKTITVTLPKLWSIELYNLPNLKSFSRTQSYAFNMPRLSEFCLFGCPMVENFTFLNTNTGLVFVQTEWHQGRKKVSDLNDYIKQNVKRGSHLCESAGESSYISDHELSSE